MGSVNAELSSVLSDVLGPLADIFGSKGLGALVDADKGEGTSLADLSSGSSSSDPDTTPEPTPDPDTTPEPTPDPDTTPEPTPSDNE